jgi:hypothetical protein
MSLTTKSASRARRGKKKVTWADQTQMSLVPRNTLRNPVLPRYGFPLRLSMRHCYTELVQVSSTTGAIGQYIFSANGMYDPNITSTGHQPMFFDEVAAVYDHYTVMSSKCKVKLFSAVAVGVGVIAAMHVDDDTSSSSNINTICEQSTAVTEVLPFGALHPITLSRAWNANAYFGGDILDNDNLQGTSAANPTEQSYYIISINATAAGTQTLFALVEIEYTAVWDELKTNQGS